MARRLVIGLVLVGIFAAGASAQHFLFRNRTQIMMYGPLIMPDGTEAPFQWGYISDRYNPKTCVMVLRRADSDDPKAFAITTVDAGSCVLNPPN